MTGRCRVLILTSLVNVFFSCEHMTGPPAEDRAANPPMVRLSIFDKDLFKQSPVVSICGDRAYLSLWSGRKRLAIEPAVRIQEKKLVYWFYGTPQPGQAEKLHYYAIGNGKASKLARSGKVFWHEPDGSFILLNRATWPCPSTCVLPVMGTALNADSATSGETNPPKETTELCKTLAANLSPNWTVSFSSASTIVIRGMVHLHWDMNAPTANQPLRKYQYMYQIRFGEKFSQCAYSEAKRRNLQLRPKAEKWYAQMESFACDQLDYNKYKSECFRPKNENQRRMLTKYKRIKNQIVELPNGFIGNRRAVFIKSPTLGADKVVEQRDVALVRKVINEALYQYAQ